MIIWIFFGHLMTPEQHQTTEYSQRSRSGKSEVIACINNQLKQRSENQRVWGYRSLGRRSSTPRRRSQRRLTASRRDGASATIDTDDATSKAARTRERRRTRDTSVGVPFCTGNQPHGAPSPHLNHSGGARNQCEMTASPAVDD